MRVINSIFIAKAEKYMRLVIIKYYILIIARRLWPNYDSIC